MTRRFDSEDEISFVAVEVCCVDVNVVITDDSLEESPVDIDGDVRVVEKISIDDRLVVRGREEDSTEEVVNVESTDLVGCLVERLDEGCSASVVEKVLVDVLVE